MLIVLNCNGLYSTTALRSATNTDTVLHATSQFHKAPVGGRQNKYGLMLPSFLHMWTNTYSTKEFHKFRRYIEIQYDAQQVT